MYPGLWVSRVYVIAMHKHMCQGSLSCDGSKYESVRVYGLHSYGYGYDGVRRVPYSVHCHCIRMVRLTRTVS